MYSMLQGLKMTRKAFPQKVAGKKNLVFRIDNIAVMH